MKGEDIIKLMVFYSPPPNILQLCCRDEGGGECAVASADSAIVAYGYDGWMRRRRTASANEPLTL